MSVVRCQKRHLRIGVKRTQTHCRATESEPVHISSQITTNALQQDIPKSVYPDINSTVLGSMVPSFRNFTTFSSEVLKLYRDFWRLVYRLPVEDQEAAKTKLRYRFRHAKYVKGHRHISQIIKQARSELEHWKGLIESAELGRSRPIESSPTPMFPFTKKHRFGDLVSLMFDPKARTFSVDSSAFNKNKLSDLLPLQINETYSSKKVSAQVRLYYLKKARIEKNIDIKAAMTSPSASQSTSASLMKTPSEFVWEDVKKSVNNMIPFVRAIGSVGYTQDHCVFKPRKEGLCRDRRYGWNLLNKRTATCVRAWEH